MKRWQKNLLATVVVVLLLVLVGPFLVPVPPLEGTFPPEELADSDSKFIEINGLKVHYRETGSGEPVFILLHGFGASLFSWHGVMEPLSKHGRVIAFDRPGFGLTERPMPGEWSGQNPYSPEAQVDITLGLMDALGLEQAIFVGNSAGGTVSVNIALNHPERVQVLILVDAAIYNGGGSPGWARPFLNTPQMQHLGPLIARQLMERGPDLIDLAWHDPSRITPEILEGYQKPYLVNNWDRALWEMTAASHPLNLAGRLDELQMPVLVITGDDDRIVPTEDSLRLAQEISGARLALIPESGHLPQEERPELFMDEVEMFLAENRQ